MVLSPLDNHTLKASFPIPRKDRLENLLSLAELISDRIISLLDLAEQHQPDFTCPEFKLPEPGPGIVGDVPLAFQQPKVTYSTDPDSVDLEFRWSTPQDSPLSPHMMEVLQQAGKSRADLTEQMYDVLKHSERLLRKSSKLGGVPQHQMFPPL